MKKDCIILFVKYPTKGEVKTRLSKSFGEDETTILYKAFVKDILAVLSKFNSDLIIFVDSGHSKEDYLNWLGKEYAIIMQEGNILGEKLGNAFTNVFNKGYNKVIVIGSDMPDIQSEILEKSFKLLENNDVIIGPSLDGGYYLLGFNKHSYTKKVFQGIEWSTDKVFKQTINMLKKNETKISILEAKSDVDTIRDLKRLYKENLNSNFKNSDTMKYLENNIGDLL